MNRTTVTKTTNTYGKNRRRSALPIVVLCLFVIFVIVGIGSSAWNIHLKLDSSSSATFVTGENANSQLSKYINNNTTESITIDGNSYPSFTYDKNEHSPTLQENLVESGETHARPLPTEWFDESYVLLAKPTASGNDWTFESAEQNLSSAPTDAGVYRYTVTPNEKAGEDAKYLGTASVDFVIVPRSVDVWILADESVYGDEHMPNVIAEGNNVFIGNDFDELKSAHTEISFKYIDSVSAASDADSLLTSLPKTAPAGDYEIIATDISLNYNITYSKGKKNADNTIVDATASDEVDYTINKRDISISFNLTNTLTKTYGEAVNKDLFYRQLVLKDAENNIVFEYKNGEFVNSIWNTESMSALDAIKSVIILDSEVTERSIVGTYDIVPTLINANYNALSGLDNKGKFEVTKLLAEIEWFGDFSFVYDGTTKVATARVMNLLFEDVCDVTVIGGAVNVGNYTATVSGLSNGNYAFNSNITHAFEITKAEISFAFDAVSFEYNKTEQKPTATNLSGIVTADSGKVSLSVTPRKQSINVDTYIADLALEGEKAGNYSISQTTVDYTITQKSLTVTWGNTNFTYNGNPQCPSVTLGGVVSNDDVSCVVTGAQTNAGNNYTARITGLGGTDAKNYKLSDNAETEKSFSIAKANLTITANDVSTIYGEDAPTFSATMTGNVEGETLNVSFDCSYAKGSNAGSYDIVPKLSGENSNYNVSITNGTLTVEKRTVTLTWTNTTLTYNGSLQTPTLTLGNVYGEDSVSASVIEGGAKDVGESYTATVKSLTNTNYKLPDNASVEFSIIPLVAVIEWIAPFSFEYDGNFHSPTARVSNLKGADKCDVIVSGSAKNVGESHTATAESLSNANYKLPESGSSQSFSITKRVLTITWKTSNLVYNGNNQHPSVTLGRVVNNEDVSCVISGAQINVGNNYTATITGLSGANKDNYQLPENGLSTDFSISQKLLTVTWGDTNFTYNGNPQCPSVTLGGVVANDDVSCVVTGAQTNAGNYTATITGLSGTDANNYKLSSNLHVDFVISQKPITITWSNTNKNGEVIFAYDSLEHCPVATVNGICDSDLSSITQTITVSALEGSTLEDGKAVNEGSYLATLSFNGDAINNYVVSGSYTVNFSITSLILVKVPTNEDIFEYTYNGLLQEFQFKSSYIDIDNIKVEGVKTATNAGNYEITVSLLDTSIYSWDDDAFSSEPKTLTWTISKAPLTIKAKDTTIVYGDAPTNNGVEYNGFVNNESANVLSGKLTYSYTYSKGDNVGYGNFSITPSGLTSQNYDITYKEGILTVEKAIPQIVITPPTLNSIYMENDIVTFKIQTKEVSGVNLRLGNFAFKNSSTLNSIEMVNNFGEYNIKVNVLYNNGEPYNSNSNVDFALETLLSFTSTNPNYKDVAEVKIGDGLVVSVKPIAYIKNTSKYYGTLHKANDAATSNQSIYLIPGSFITLSDDLSIKSNVSLYIPYQDELWDISSDSQIVGNNPIDTNPTNVKNNRKSQITFTNGADLIIPAGASVYLGAIASTKGIYSSYTEITLDKESSINVSGNFYCFGYVKEVNHVLTDLMVGYENNGDENRYIEISSTGYLKTFVAIYDMSSGGDVYTLNSNKICPLNTFDFAALQTYLKIQSGARVDATVRIVVGTSENPTYINEVASIVRKNTSEDALFYIKDGYIAIEYLSQKEYVDLSTISNIYLAGNINIGYLKFKVSIATVNTSEYFLPFSYKLNVYSLSQSNVEINYKVKLLPGSLLQMNEGATLTLSSSLAIHTKDAFYNVPSTRYASGKEDARFINNGKLILTNTGAIGGEVKTTQLSKDVAICDFSKTTANSFKLSSNEGKSNVSVFYNAQGRFFNESENTIEIGQFAAGSIIHSYGSDDCWYGEMNMTSSLKVVVTDSDDATGVRVCGYHVYQADDASGSGQVELTAVAMSEDNSFDLTRGKYFKVVENDYKSASFSSSPDGTNPFQNDTWIKVTGDFTLNIVANEGFQLKIGTEKESGAGTTKYKLYTSKSNSGTYTLTEKSTDDANWYINLVKGTWFYIEFSGGANSSFKQVVVDYTEKKKGPESLGTNDFKFGSSNKYELTCEYYIFVYIKPSESCIVEGTLITLADGTQKKVEDLTNEDILLVFNHETGKYDTAKLVANIHDGVKPVETLVVGLHFSDDTYLGIVWEHGLFDKTLNQYVFIRENNALEFVGHEFVTSKFVDGKVVTSSVTLEQVTFESKVVRVFSPATVWHLNIVSNDLLTIGGGFVNFFAYDETMKFDEELMQKDIEEYGLFTYEDFKEYLTEFEFTLFPFKYYKVAIGKGETTMETLMWLLSLYRNETTIRPSEGNGTNNLDTTNKTSDSSKGSTSGSNRNAEYPPNNMAIPPTTATSSSGGSNGDGSNDDES